jgi:hypothetical protein
VHIAFLHDHEFLNAVFKTQGTSKSNVLRVGELEIQYDAYFPVKLIFLQELNKGFDDNRLGRD